MHSQAADLFVSSKLYLACIGAATEMAVIRKWLPNADLKFVSFEEFKTLKIGGELPYAVVVYTTKIPVSFIKELHSIRTLLEGTSIPLMVIGTDFSLQDKRFLLTNGADDCINSNSNHDGFDRWIEFLTLSKKVALTKNPIKIENEEHKIPFTKRAFDVVASSFALILLSPILLIIASTIKLESKGPVIYSSKRAGSDYKVFNFLKFRSMYVGADAELIKIKHLNQYGNGEGNSVFFKLENDPRVTRVGNFLRNTSLDELPQLLNVLKGDMSIVGNRPLPLYEAQMLTKDYAAMRFLAPAGITGLWQVTKRGKKELSEEERIELDVEYANNHSLKNDINIVMKTLPALAQEVSV